MRFPRQGYWSELPFSSPGGLPDPEIKPTSPAAPVLAGGFFPTSATWEVPVVVQFSSVTQSCSTLWNPMNCSTLGLPIQHQLPEPTQTHVHWVSGAIQPSHPLSSPSPLAFDLSQHQGLFKWVGSLHQWPKYWSFSFSISPSNEYSGLISFRMDWLVLREV